MPQDKVEFYKHDFRKSASRLSLNTLRSGHHSTAGNKNAFTAFSAENEAFGFQCYSGGSASVYVLEPQQIRVARWLCDHAGKEDIYLRTDGVSYSCRVRPGHASWTSGDHRLSNGEWSSALRLTCTLQMDHITLPVTFATIGEETLRVSYYESGSNLGYTNMPEGPYVAMTLQFEDPDEWSSRGSMSLDRILSTPI